MSRYDTPTARPIAPGCTCSDRGLCSHCQWAQSVDAVDYQPPRTTAPLPPPDAVIAARLLRAERATHMHRVDRIDEALRTLLAGMSPAQRRELDG